jgi:lipoyl synthase
MATMNDLLSSAWNARRANFPPQLTCYAPSKTVPVSVTGTACALDCGHCGGHYLRHMAPLCRAATDSRLPGATSLLISGGCDADGHVPLLPHLDAVIALKGTRRLNWHVGFIGPDEVAQIQPYVDVVSFDFVGDDRTIREVYGFDRSVADYVACLRMLQANVRVVPHVTVGLAGGEIRGERQAISELQALGVDSLVFLVFIPTPGTRYASRLAPCPDEAARLIAEARVMLPKAAITLGCMRPGGSYRAELDPLAVKAGVNSIVNPARTARTIARNMGLTLVDRDECCVF